MTTPTTTRPAATPVRPCARNVWAALKAAGIAHLVRRVTTGRKHCHVHIAWTNADDLRYQHNARWVADVLRPLWHDGHERVDILYGGKVTITVQGYWDTFPNTPDGMAALAEREEQRNGGLLRARNAGRRLTGPDHIRVDYAPREDDPRRPWADRYGNRFTPFQVFAL